MSGLATVLFLTALMLFPFLRQFSSFLFILTVVACAFFGGRGPAFVSIALCSLGEDYYIIEPIHSLSLGFGYLPRLLVGGLVAVIIVNLINHLKEQERSLRQLALSDHLTGLPNRRLFEELLAHDLARLRRDQESCAVLFIDVDKFKSVNDTWGHAAGDALLAELASRFVSCIRAEDSVARLSGDEFAVFLNSVHKDAAEPAVRKILGASREAFKVSEAVIMPSISIGGAFFPQDGATLTQLLTRADERLYQAKRRRDSYCLASEAESTAP